MTGADLTGPNAWVQIELAGGDAPLEVDRIVVDDVVRSPSEEPEAAEGGSSKKSAPLPSRHRDVAGTLLAGSKS